VNFFINEFSILSPTEKKAFNEKFEEKINLVIGEKDSGKSSLARSILYTLGCDVRNLDFISKMPENIYIIDFNIDENNYLLIRKKLKGGKGKNFFKIIRNRDEIKNFYDTKGFKDYLNDIMGIELVTTDRENRETKLYPNHIFLPFYTDQDFSWQSYLTSTFTGIPFINNYKKIILEYFTGARSNEYYKLQLQKNILNSRLIERDALIKSKELIIEENNKNIKIIENINIEEFQRQYEYALNMYNNIVETEHKLKRELNEKIYKKNSLLEMKVKLDSSIDEIINQELGEKCPNCKQEIHKDMEENYKLLLTQQNLIKEREKLNMYLEEAEEEISYSMSNVKNIKYENVELRNKLNADAEIIKLSDRANSYALNQVNEKLLDEVSKLRVLRDKDQESLEKVEKSLNDLNKINVAKEYKELMIKAFEDLEIPFAYKNYYVSNLESVNIMLSGATKVQAYIAQYLSIYRMAINAENTINIPMFIDTFLKDDFNGQEKDRTSKYIFNNLKDNFQSFIFISNNEQTIESISSYEYNEIDLVGRGNLLNKDYNSIYDRYVELLKEA
jgi:DNA repair exonuclease SbcCD ATPase subunit